MSSEVSEAIAELGLPAEADFAVLSEHVASIYGKPIRFEAISAKAWGAITGLWIDRAADGIILYRADDPLVYQLHSILHEYGHIVLRHTGCDLIDLVGTNLVGHVGVRRGVEKALARGGEANELERAAEQVAFDLAKRILRNGDDVDSVFG